MRARSIKPGICDNEVLGTADPFYTLLFERLWMIADREGRLEDRPLRIKAQAFPYRDGLDVEPMLAWLAAQGFIARYTAGQGRYIQILAFGKHQNPHKNEVASVLPPMAEQSQPLDEVVPPSSERLGLTPSSLTPDSGLRTPDSRLPTPPAQPASPECVVEAATKELAAAGRMAASLRDLGVNVTSMNPTLIEWLRSGFTVDQVSEAVAVARQSPGKETGSVAPNYIDRILRQPARPPPNGATSRGKTAWDRMMEANGGD
jgi:hypothetical protein